MGTRERFKLSLSVFLLVIRDDEVLLILRSGTGWMDGHYSVPAGALDGRETLTAAVCREAKEETGITVSEENLQLVHTVHALTGGEEWTGVFFAVHEWTGEPTLMEPDKHSELRWAPIGALPVDTIAYVKTAIAGLRSGQTYSTYGWNDK